MTRAQKINKGEEKFGNDFNYTKIYEEPMAENAKI